MSWLTSWPESIKKRACRYLLQHYLGQFLQEKLRLEQLSVDLYNGTGHVSNVALDIWSLNEMLDQAHIPMELIDGYIGSIVVSIPWSALLKDNCKVEIKGLEITLQPKYRTDADLSDVTDSFYRSLGSMTTSMQLAEKCLKEEEDESQNTSSGGLFEGLDVFAQTIESVLSRVKVSLTDIVIRVEHLPENSKNGIAVEMQVDRIDYFDEITMEDGTDTPSSQTKNQSSDKKPVFQKDSITCKRFQATGVRIYLDEFPEHLRTSPQDSPQDGSSSPINVPDIPEFQTMTDPEHEFNKAREETTKADGPLLIGKFFGTHELKLRIRQNEHATAPKIDAECFLGSCGMFLTPNQVHLLAEFASGISSPVSVNPTSTSRDDEFSSLQTNHFATCTEGIKLSPHAGNFPPDGGVQTYNQSANGAIRKINYSQPEVEGNEQFFSMEGSRLYSHSPPEPSEYSQSEYGTSIYSQSTGFTPSSFANSRALKIPSMHPSSKMMGAGHHGEGRYGFPPSSPPRVVRRHSSGRDEDKSLANHCRYQLHIRAMALTVLHVNPLPVPASPRHSYSNTRLDSDLSKTSQSTLSGSDVDSSLSTLCSDRGLTDSSNCHKEMSQKYFKTCESVLDDILRNDRKIDSIRSDLASVCSPHDHLRLTTAHMHLNAELKASHNTNTELSFGKAEITECVFTNSSPMKSKYSNKSQSPKLRKRKAIHSEILVFDASSDTSPAVGRLNADPKGVSPNIRIRMSSIETSRTTKTSLHVHLSACESEVDISIVDRISTLLYPPENPPKVPSTNVSLFSPTSCYSHSNPDAFNRQAAFKEALTDDTKEKQLHFNVSASFLRINFRFPIADLRPEMERRPWYNRSLRDETLILEAHDIAFLTSALGSNVSSSYAQHNWHSPNPSTNQQRQEFEITVKDLHVLYSDEPDKPPGKPKSFLRISQSPADMEPHGGPIDANSDLDCPHIKVTINPAQQTNNNLLLQGSTADCVSPENLKKSHEKNGMWFDEDFPLDGSHEGSCGGNPSPFSQRRVVYNNKEMILPGDPSEISNFSEHAIATSLISISIHLPAVNAFLISKSFFENLYNRINNDILLWAPAAPKPHGKVKSWFDSKTVSYLGDSQLQYPGSEKGLDCASQLLVKDLGDRDDSISSDSDSDDEVRTNYSGRPSLLGASRRVVKSVNENSASQQSLISITTKIGYGRVSAKCNVLSPNGTVSETEHGEVVIMLENANIFNVASYCGNPLLDYVCIQISDLSLYHRANIPSLSSVHTTVDRLSIEAPSHLDKVLTKCEEGISRTFGKSANESHMLVLAIKIETEEDKPMKQCLIAAGVNGVMLLHRFAQTGMSWLEQIIDFVDATDEDVPGYKPPSFITEVHLNVKNSAAVYKPLYMDPPIRAVLTASSFTLSSNIVAGAADSILDVIIDEAKLYITNQKDAYLTDLLSDFACILDVNVFELCLKLSKPPFENPDASNYIKNFYPLIDFQASNNLIRLRTCADSCAALGALVRYLADDGDLLTQDQDDDEEEVDDGSASDYQSQVDMGPSGWTDQSPILEGEQELEDDDDDDNLTEMMADAMEDIFVDAKSEFGEFKTKPNLAMTESMYAFSSSKKSQAPGLPHKSVDIMSQSVMIPSEFGKRGRAKNDSHVFPRHEGRDLYYSAFHRRGVCSHSDQPDDDEFCIIDDELGMSHQSSEPEIRYRSSEDDTEECKPIEIEENHFKPALGKIDQLQAPEHFPTPVVRYTLKELSCVWYMYGGFDFKNPDTPSRKNSGSGSHISPIKRQSSPIQLRYNAKKRNLSINQRGSSRDSTMLMELHLTKVRARYEQYPEDTLEAARTVFIVSDFEVRDKLQSSSINKFLYRFHSEASPRQSHAKALLLKILQIRPEGAGSPTESRLRISLQPLRLNVDQDTLNFLTKFFTEISSSVSEENGPSSNWMPPASTYETAVGSPSSTQNHASPKNLSTPYASPVMTRPKSNSISSAFSGDLPNGSSPSTKSASSSGKSVSHDSTPLQPVFFREVIFSPEVPIQLDYHGKRIDTEQGTISGLLMGLGQLNCSQLKLKRVVHRHGVLGVDKLVTFLLNEWAADIRANQLPLILGGVGPMHSVVQLFKGVRDLVYLPVEQYRKDGRIVRGLQRGATSFGTSTAMATLEITNRAIGLIQSAAETTYELVSPQELHTRELRAQKNWQTLGNHAIRRQPADIREGVSNAFTVVKQGVEDTAGALVRAAQKEHERRGVTGAVGGVVRHIPSTLVKPVILATEATSNVLSGIRNQIQPDAKQQDEDKWKNLNEDDMS